MSFKASLVKNAIKCTPNKMIMWVANTKLKGIAELTEFNLDFDARTVFLQAYLVGEAEPIELSVDGFAVNSDGQSHRFFIRQGQSNKVWLNNLLAHVVGKEWKIPAIPQIQPYMGLITELLQPERPMQEDEPQPEVDAGEEDEGIDRVV